MAAWGWRTRWIPRGSRSDTTRCQKDVLKYKYKFVFLYAIVQKLYEVVIAAPFSLKPVHAAFRCFSLRVRSVRIPIGGPSSDIRRGLTGSRDCGTVGSVVAHRPW